MPPIQIASVENYSFSRIEKWLKCGEFFRKHYLDPTIVKCATDTIPMAAGTVVHAVLYDYHAVPHNPTSVLTILDATWDITLENFSECTDRLIEIKQDLAGLYVRAGKGYKGLDAIVDENGKPYKSPTATKIWEREVQKLKLPQRQNQIDSTLRLLGKPYTTVSASSVYFQTYKFLEKYTDQIGRAGMTVRAREIKFSDIDFKNNTVNFPVYFPGLNRDVLFTGIIDLIVTNAEGLLGIIDHKTSKPPAPKVSKVMHWEQLLLYCYAHFIAWGRMPDFIGINSIQSNQLVTAPVHTELVMRAVSRKVAAIKAIDAGLFIEQNPTDYGANCMNEYTKESCGYLNLCHPEFFALLGSAT